MSSGAPFETSETEPGETGEVGEVGEAMAPNPPPALLRVTRGLPNAEELTALTVVMAALSRRTVAPRPTADRSRSAWAAPERAVRRLQRPESGGWRASAFPS